MAWVYFSIFKKCNIGLFLCNDFLTFFHHATVCFQNSKAEHLDSVFVSFEVFRGHNKMSSNCSPVQCVEDQNKQHFCLVILLLNDASDRQKCLVHPVLNEEFQEKYWFRKSYKLTSCIVWFWVQILQSTSCQRHLTLSKRRLMQLRIQGFKLSTQLWTITKWINNSRASFLMNKVFLPLSRKFFISLGTLYSAKRISSTVIVVNALTVVAVPEIALWQIWRRKKTQ